jgi:hypothetical protein
VLSHVDDDIRDSLHCRTLAGGWVGREPMSAPVGPRTWER